MATLKDGRDLDKQSARDIQESQSAEQLALIKAALMIYQQLVPDDLDSSISGQPIRGQLPG